MLKGLVFRECLQKSERFDEICVSFFGRPVASKIYALYKTR